MPQPVIVCHLGRIDYLSAWELQKRLQARIIAAKRASPHEALPHVMLLVEHPPVYTLGKSGNRANLLLSPDGLAARGAAFYPIDRGGDITYHGPGQLVGYPILDLGRFFTDIHRYLRELEEMTIRTCADYSLEAARVPGRTGVWVGPDVRGLERKVCAMGIRCSRWVTMHGFALNLNTDLGFFDHIIPCGIADRSVTSLAAELGHAVDEADVRACLLHHFAQGFDALLTYLDGSDARAFLAGFLEPERATLAPGFTGA